MRCPHILPLTYHIQGLSRVEDSFFRCPPPMDSNPDMLIQSRCAASSHNFTKSPSWHQNGTKIRTIWTVSKKFAGKGVAESMRLSVVLLGS